MFDLSYATRGVILIFVLNPPHQLVSGFTRAKIVEFCGGFCDGDPSGHHWLLSGWAGLGVRAA